MLTEASRRVPSAMHTSPFLLACLAFEVQEMFRWAPTLENGDIDTDRWPLIDAAEAPLLHIICDTPAHTAVEQAARAACIEASEPEIDAGRLSQHGARMVRAMLRDLTEAG